MKKILTAMFCLGLGACSQAPANEAYVKQTAYIIPDPLVNPQPQQTAATQAPIVVYTNTQPVYRNTQPVITYIEAPAPHRRFATPSHPTYYYPHHEQPKPEKITGKPHPQPRHLGK